MEIDKEIIDKLLTNHQKPEDIVGENGLLKQLTKAPQSPKTLAKTRQEAK